MQSNLRCMLGRFSAVLPDAQQLGFQEEAEVQRVMHSRNRLSHGAELWAFYASCDAHGYTLYMPHIKCKMPSMVTLT